MKSAMYIAIGLLISGLVSAADAPAVPDEMSAEHNAAANSHGQLTSEDFVKNASQDGMLEVEAGKVALAQGSNSDVKAFAQRMVADHGKANDELKTIAADKHISISDKLDTKHQAKLTALKAKTGTDFDKAYGADMMKGHEQAVALFKQASTSSTVNADLQLFARKTLPTLQEHAKLAMKLPK